MSPARRSLLIYGATGYSGRLLVQQAVSRGLAPIVAGRDARKLEALATPLGLSWNRVELHDMDSLSTLAASATVVLNAAGPFADTALPLVSACITGGAHYLDISGEVRSIEAVAGQGDVAVQRGVMLMPAVGFDVVPSDCLAAHTARRVPDAASLRIGIDMRASLSRGSLLTGLAQAGDGIWVRRDGVLVSTAPAGATHRFDFGDGSRTCLAVSLGDVSTAHHSTGIPNIETYLIASIPLWTTLNAMRAWGPVLASRGWRDVIASRSGLADGPTDAARQSGSAVIVAEVIDSNGRRACSRLRTPEAYTVTADAAISVAQRVLDGSHQPGFQTPSRMFGPDFVLSLAGMTRDDL